MSPEQIENMKRIEAECKQATANSKDRLTQYIPKGGRYMTHSDIAKRNAVVESGIVQ